MRLSVNLSDLSSIDAAIDELKKYSADLERKSREICYELAKYGAMTARVLFASAKYDGENDAMVYHTPTEDGYKVVANGRAALFLEFGAGVRYGYGHPLAQAIGMGPGTWPYPHGQTVNGKFVWNWENPKGWHFVNESGKTVHTYGNAPSKAMYTASKVVRRSIKKVAKEVFGR